MGNDIGTPELSVDHFMISTFENQLLFMPIEKEGAIVLGAVENWQKNEWTRDFRERSVLRFFHEKINFA